MWIVDFNENVWHFIVRLAISVTCGILIGFERKNRSKEAGIRTHAIVCMAATLFMIVSRYLTSADFGGAGTTGDPARIGAQIVTGIGFLGAGIIFVQKRTVTGLTTAAGIWATSGIGMAIGAGMYSLGILSTAILLSAQIVLHKNSRFMRTPKFRIIKVKSDKRDGFQQYATELLNKNNIAVLNVGITKPEGKEYTVYEFEVEFSPEISEESTINLFECECSVKPCR